MPTTFFTVVDERYERFAVPWIASTLHFNPDDHCELVVRNTKAFRQRFQSALGLTQERFGESFRIRQEDFGSLGPARLRFLLEPRTQNEFFYISDCDILVLEGDIEWQHLVNMRLHRCPYSNEVRKKNGKLVRRLTGLHFGATKSHFPLPNLDDLDLAATRDETILYSIVERKLGDPRRFAHMDFRPIHGIHTSPHRSDPLGTRPNWCVTPVRLEVYVHMMLTDFWQDLVPYLDAEYREKILGRLHALSRTLL